MHWKRCRLEDEFHESEARRAAETPRKAGTVVTGERKVTELENALREHRDLQELRDGPQSDMSVAYASGAESLRLNDRYRTTAMNRFLRGVENLLRMKEERAQAHDTQRGSFDVNLRLLGDVR